MDLKKIQYFQAIAQYGSISEAARHLFIVQPALSRQMKELEYYMGVKLFERQARGIALTPAGNQLLKDSPHILGVLEQARDNARRAAGISEVLHIGIAPTYTWNPTITHLIKGFQEKYKNIKLVLEPTLAVSQTERLTDGSLDAGFMAWRPKADSTKEGIAIFNCKLLIACAIGSRVEDIARHAQDDLIHENCILFPREQSPEFYDFMMLQCAKANFAPKVQETAFDFNSALGLASTGSGYTIISSASQFNCPHNIVLIEAKKLTAQYKLEFVYQKPIKKDTLLTFINFINDTMTKSDHLDNTAQKATNIKP